MSDLADLLARAYQAQSPSAAARHYRQAFKKAFVGSREHVRAGEGLGRALEKLEFSQALAHYRGVLDDDVVGLHRYAYERVTTLAEQIGDHTLALETIRLAVGRRVPTGVGFRRRAWRIADAAGVQRPFVPLRLLDWMREERGNELCWYYAEMARDRGAWSLAARRYGRVAAGSRRYAEAQTWRGHCLEQLLQVDDAIAAYQRAVAVYEAAYRRDPAYATVIRRPFDRLIALYELRGETERALGVIRSALETARKKPPQSWWGRATRIAEQAGEELNREAWEAAFKRPLERYQDPLPAEASALVHDFRDELRRLREGQIPPEGESEHSHKEDHNGSQTFHP